MADNTEHGTSTLPHLGIAKDLENELKPILVINQMLLADTSDYPQGPNERTHGPGYIFVLCESDQHGVHSDYYKVGLTNNLKKRLCDLQSGNPRPLVPVRLIKVKNMESIGEFLETNLKPLSEDLHGGKDWYKSREVNGKVALLEIIDLVKNKVEGSEISQEQFKDYAQYYIYFSKTENSH